MGETGIRIRLSRVVVIRSIDPVKIPGELFKELCMSTSMMQAIRIQDYGGPEMLELQQVPRPEPKAGEVLVRILAAGVNPADWKMRSGMYKAFMPLTFPWTPGLEGAGIIESVGPDVSSLHPGQAVYGRIQGAYAEYAAAPAGDLQLNPTALTFEQAASVPVGALTAWQAVIEIAQVQPGQRVLVHGAAGGVGVYAVQLAKWKGAHVVGTASASNLEFVQSLGAEQVIDYNAAPFETAIKDLDAVIDTVGGDLPERSLKVIRPGGVLVSAAARLSPEMGQARNIRTPGLGRAGSEKLAQINQLLESKQVLPVVGATFPLSEAKLAQELSQTGHGRGRIILRISG
jgi:NADPH:quinone reductase-like Zn-dependent oxidoreductase